MRPVHLDPLIDAEAATGLEEEILGFAAQCRRLPAVLQPELFIRVKGFQNIRYPVSDLNSNMKM
jgi:hypothetical protein